MTQESEYYFMDLRAQIYRKVDGKAKIISGKKAALEKLSELKALQPGRGWYVQPPIFFEEEDDLLIKEDNV